jgi:hypothetical protein
MEDGATQCQAAIKALTSIQERFGQLHALRVQLGPGLFEAAGGPWTGGDATQFQGTLTDMLTQEQRFLGQGQDLLQQLNALLTQLEQLGV